MNPYPTPFGVLLDEIPPEGSDAGWSTVSKTPSGSHSGGAESESKDPKDNGYAQPKSPYSFGEAKIPQATMKYIIGDCHSMASFTPGFLSPVSQSYQQAIHELGQLHNQLRAPGRPPTFGEPKWYHYIDDFHWDTKRATVQSSIQDSIRRNDLMTAVHQNNAQGEASPLGPTRPEENTFKGFVPTPPVNEDHLRLISLLQQSQKRRSGYESERCESLQVFQTQLMSRQQQNEKHLQMLQDEQRNLASQPEIHDNYQSQVLVLEQQNKLRLQMARDEQYRVLPGLRSRNVNHYGPPQPMYYYPENESRFHMCRETDNPFCLQQEKDRHLCGLKTSTREFIARVPQDVKEYQSQAILFQQQAEQRLLHEKEEARKQLCLVEQQEISSALQDYIKQRDRLNDQKRQDQANPSSQRPPSIQPSPHPIAHPVSGNDPYIMLAHLTNRQRVFDHTRTGSPIIMNRPVNTVEDSLSNIEDKITFFYNLSERWLDMLRHGLRDVTLYKEVEQQVLRDVKWVSLQRERAGGVRWW